MGAVMQNENCIMQDGSCMMLGRGLMSNNSWIGTYWKSRFCWGAASSSNTAAGSKTGRTSMSRSGSRFSSGGAIYVE